MPSTDQACAPLPASIDRAPWGGDGSPRHAACAVTRGGIGRSTSPSASPAPLPGLQKHDNRIVHCGRAPAAAKLRKNRGEPQARASRLTADDRRRPARPVAGTLTPKVVQNIGSNDGLGFRRVNFASAAFSSEHFLIRPGVHTSNRGVARR